ncbi:glycoside hydrolase [Nadsonia fulvescens var. elongata DSM 6958]|uniref:glucan endo-1,3-beta-D-glucosidase n=1 Tax=Nadsonia fulvescens var. elongata DSM 6958 TaxID=857566 RepID=A0A1E3PFS5_9ASCO|nr:glycoside hydrolase [Nadsonia fulvescens var. elongata DSM 6958]
MSYSGDIFTPISTDEPLAIFPRVQHPLPIPSGVTGPNGSPLSAIPTNNFYTNLLLESQTGPSFVLPYSVWWAKDPQANFFGLAVSHTRASQRVFGPDPNSDPAKFFLNPIGIMSVVLGATGFNNETMRMELDSPDTFSVNVKISNGATQLLAPLAQGMGFVTARYTSAIPLISSLVGFRSVENVVSLRAGIKKYKLSLFDETTWIMYVTGAPENLTFSLSDNNHLLANCTVSDVVFQVAYCPDASLEYIFDDTAGIYPVGVSLDGSTSGGQSATYSLNYQIMGSSNSGSGLIYALPHHVESFDDQTRSRVSNLRVSSLTKGDMVGVVANSLVMVETELPTQIQFLPWSTLGASTSNLNADNIKLIESIAEREVEQNITGQTNLDSMYFSGKGLDKFAFILLTIHDIIGNRDLALRALDKLKMAFEVFTTNQQIHPLAYDTAWKGIVSTAGLNGDSGQDFGNSYYNDHHFHYGYFIHAAAIIAHVDSAIGDNTWLAHHRQWVNNLLRDVANPSSYDVHFPVSRSFNWYHGHSWAKGLFMSGDGKDQESSSEDYHFAYGMKLWGQVVGDGAMVARGNLMLSIMRRSFNKYVLYTDDNTVEPSQFIKNRVNGITFENKLDYSTYFGLNTEYIHGIHMIPITPVSSFIRSPLFVQQEWDSKLASIADGLDSGWKGILKLNQALYKPDASVAFFADEGFKDNWLDGGMSRTWSLAYSLAVGSN